MPLNFRIGGRGVLGVVLHFSYMQLCYWSSENVLQQLLEILYERLASTLLQALL